MLYSLYTVAIRSVETSLNHFKRNRLLSDLKKRKKKTEAEREGNVSTRGRNGRVGRRGRCETGDKRARVESVGGSRGNWALASLLRFSEAFLHFTRGRAGSWRLLRDLLGNLCPDGAQPRCPSRAAPACLLPPIYNFSAHLRQLSDARERALQLSSPGDSILRRVVYHRRDRKNCRLRVERRDLLPGKSHAVAVAVAVLKAKAQTWHGGNI